MDCPECGEKTRVAYTHRGNYNLRYRVCKNCKISFDTIELPHYRQEILQYAGRIVEELRIDRFLEKKT